MWIFIVCIGLYCWDYEDRGEAVDKYIEAIQNGKKEIEIDSIYVEVNSGY